MSLPLYSSSTVLKRNTDMGLFRKQKIIFIAGNKFLFSRTILGEAIVTYWNYNFLLNSPCFECRTIKFPAAFLLCLIKKSCPTLVATSFLLKT